ncbi:MAG: FkbM family methyltransferase [Geminicoccaceae bacterium]|nr:FkbM family methyltransferase [Geminicoccaceae bacterium]
MSPLRTLARRFGYDLVPRGKSKDLAVQLDLLLKRAGISLVLDVGANLGQYARRLRAQGYSGRIVSFEPLEKVHAELTSIAAADPRWEIAPRMALGAAGGEVTIEVSAEADMSSILPQSELLRAISPTSRISGRESVRLERLDIVGKRYLHPDDRVFLKVDTQGYEAAVLDGAGALLPRLHDIQLELSLVPLYEGEDGFRAMLERMAKLGFEPHLILPGYFERKLARQLQVDVVFMRGEPDPTGRSARQGARPGGSAQISAGSSRST